MKLPCLALFAAACCAHAQLPVLPTHKYSWSENAGRMNWFDAANGSCCVRVHGTFLSGKIWLENVGWAIVGAGTPANGVAYANQNGTDVGVNHDLATGMLTGYAWSENAGWLSFGGGALATPAKPARISVGLPRRFFGFIWSENLGWISLDSASDYVQLNTCPADFNFDSQVDDADFVRFAQAYDLLECSDTAMPAGCGSDLNGDGIVSDADFVLFAHAYDTLVCP